MTAWGRKKRGEDEQNISAPATHKYSMNLEDNAKG